MRPTTYIKVLLAVVALIGAFVFPANELLFLGIFAGFVDTILLDFEI